MPYYIKSSGPVVVERGPFETQDDAKAAIADFLLNPLYQGQEFFVEPGPYAPQTPRRSTSKPVRGKARSRRGRSGARPSGRSTGGAASSSTPKRPRKRRNGRVSRRR